MIKNMKMISENQMKLSNAIRSQQKERKMKENNFLLFGKPSSIAATQKND